MHSINSAIQKGDNDIQILAECEQHMQETEPGHVMHGAGEELSHDWCFDCKDSFDQVRCGCVIDYGASPYRTEEGDVTMYIEK